MFVRQKLLFRFGILWRTPDTFTKNAENQTTKHKLHKIWLSSSISLLVVSMCWHDTQRLFPVISAQYPQNVLCQGLHILHCTAQGYNVHIIQSRHVKSSAVPGELTFRRSGFLQQHKNGHVMAHVWPTSYRKYKQFQLADCYKADRDNSIRIN